MNSSSLIYAAVTAIGFASVASAENFQPVPGMIFEHRFYESGDEDFFVQRDGVDFVYRPSVRSLTVGNNVTDLSGETYKSLDEADFSEAFFFKAENDERLFCIEFGFGGLLRSGSLQRIRGKLVVQAGNRTGGAVLYLKGPDVHCASAGDSPLPQH